MGKKAAEANAKAARAEVEALKGSARHEETHALATGEGAAAAVRPRAAKQQLWDLSAPEPKWTPRALGISKALSPEVAAALELESAKALRALRRSLDELCQNGGLKAHVRPLTLERWRWAAKWEEDQAAGKKTILHPVMPSKPAKDADGELEKELQRQGLSAKGAASAVTGLRAAAAGLADRLLKQAHAIASGGKPLAAPQLKLTFNRHNIDFACGKTQLKVAHPVYGKLAILHRRHAPESEVAPAPPSLSESEEAEAAEAAAAKTEAEGAGAAGRSKLHMRIFANLLRYRSLQGDGFQAAIGKPVWENLQATLGVGCECFASPLNAYLPAFGSGFADVDGPFGSRGSFFAFKPSAGSFAANPPFVHPIMDAMAAHILGLLKAAEEAQGEHALSFTVIIPGWKESDAYTQSECHRGTMGAMGVMGGVQPAHSPCAHPQYSSSSDEGRSHGCHAFASAVQSHLPCSRICHAVASAVSHRCCCPPAEGSTHV